jgi:methionine salvage enolase-phosphatase E1
VDVTWNGADFFDAEGTVCPISFVKDVLVGHSPCYSLPWYHGRDHGNNGASKQFLYVCY